MKTSIICRLFKYTFPVILLVLLATLGSQTVRAEDTNVMGQLSSRDYKFVKEAMEAGTMEVTLGQLASQQASNQVVRSFGDRMVQDHQKANQQLAQLISQKGATVEPSDKKANEMASDLKEKTGMDFDKAYIKQMISDHKSVIKEFQTESTKGDDADVKNWATQTLPTLQDHLRLAESAKTELESKPEVSAQ